MLIQFLIYMELMTLAMSVNFVENNFDETNKEEFSQKHSTGNILSLNHFPDTCTLESGSIKSWYYNENVGFLCTCKDGKLQTQIRN